MVRNELDRCTREIRHDLIVAPRGCFRLEGAARSGYAARCSLSLDALAPSPLPLRVGGNPLIQPSTRRNVEPVMNDTDGEFTTVIELEQRLLEPRVRLDRDALEALLHEDFSEFGASGRIYDRDSIIEALSSSDGASAKAFAFQATRLGPDAILLTYRTDTPSLRTSVWVRGSRRSWQVRHHQGTPAAS
jgi:ribonuclease HI